MEILVLKKLTLAGLMSVVAACFVVPAAAEDREDCVRGSGDAAIEACTRLVGSGRFNKSNLALIYSNRANQWEHKGDLDKAMQDHAAFRRTLYDHDVVPDAQAAAMALA